MEPILRARATELGGDLRFHTELVSFEQDAEGVSAVIRDRTTRIERRIRARYLVAADGNRSAIRKQLGIEVQGQGVQGHQISILFSADIQGALRERRIAICFVNNPILRGGTLILARGEGRGYGLYAHYHPEKGELVEGFAGARGIEVVRAAIGVPDLPVEIMSVIPWEVATWTAERFQQDNVFLVGDSAHVNPPTGAFGANTGIADAYNLAWKLAFVLKGEAGSELLSTYTAERQPVARFTVEQAFAWFVRFASPSAAKNSAPAVDYDEIAFGYRYPATSSSSQDQVCYEDPHHPTGRPGTHAPHVILQRQEEQISTFDLFGRHFVLLTGPDGQSWKDGARHAAQQLGLVLETCSIGDTGDLLDPDGRFLAAYGVGTNGAVLVRPDGFIAWRAECAQKDAGQVLESVLMQLLGRSAISTHNEIVYT
jgi:2-polyprenyl-6-methoxyphenol hydroxylase-like FAD-dependent oxidoreductase